MVGDEDAQMMELQGTVGDKAVVLPATEVGGGGWGVGLVVSWSRAEHRGCYRRGTECLVVSAPKLLQS